MKPFLASYPSPLIIAEIGAKYADIDTLKRMVTVARDVGADMVKFQTYRAETISTPGNFFTFEDGSKVPQFEFFKKYELNREDHEILDAHCKALGIDWISTPSHPEDVDLLESFDPLAYKTGSDDLTNLPFLKHIAERGRPMLVSTGMCTLNEIRKAVETILATGNDQLVLLHCVVSYPSQPEDANIRVIETLGKEFGLPIGLSDHTTDEFTSVLAIALGAVVIEKHFCMDRSLGLPDAQAALDTEEFRHLVERVRLAPKALGNGIKTIAPTEEKWRAASRKSLFSTRPIAAGKIIEADDIAIRRPSDGIHPHELEKMVGRTARQDIAENTLLTWDMV
jgi:N,N'-diacetyllegionaminate synthase